MQTLLTYEITPDADELARGTRHIQLRNSKLARLIWPLWGLFALAFVYSLSRGAEPGQLVWFITFLVGIPAIRLLVPWQMRRTWRRHLAETPGLDGPQLYEFMENGLSIRNRISSALLGWEAIVEAEETPEFFLIYSSKIMAYAVPKRVMGGADDEAALRSLLREHLGARAAKLR